MKLYFSRAYWEDGSETSDTHDTHSQAMAVARKLWHEGNDKGMPERTEALWTDDTGRTQEMIAYSKVFPSGNVPTAIVTTNKEKK